MRGKRAGSTSRLQWFGWCLSAIVIVACPTISAEECPSPTVPRIGHGTYSIMFENDLFAGTDQDYTNGIKLSYVTHDLSGYLDWQYFPTLAQGVVRWINQLFPCRQKNIGVSVAQKLFTPVDTQRLTLDLDDRPYAAWLYGGLAFHAKTKVRLDSLELQIGVVGPGAQGEETQNWIHDLRNLAKTRGWQHQLENEPGIILIYDHRDRFRRADFFVRELTWDLISHYGAAVGNVMTYANAGAELRFGYKVPYDFGTSLMRPGGDANAPAAYQGTGSGQFGAHAFIALGGRWVLRDIFLDGNTFTNSHSVDKEDIVAEVIVGAGVNWQRFKLTYATVFRTRQFKGQASTPEFGSISLSYYF